MTGEIDTTYQTMQRDLFAGGLAAKIGANAFAVWSAIKYHADFESGHAWPSIRRLAEMTGIGKTSVMRAVATLEAEHMLRKAATGWPSNPSKGGRGHSHTYIACERLDVRLGARVICTIVIDYVPHRLADKLAAVKDALHNPDKADPALWAEVRILPGEGFAWDPTRKALVAQIPVQEVAAEAARRGPPAGVREKLAAKSAAILGKAR